MLVIDAVEAKIGPGGAKSGPGGSKSTPGETNPGGRPAGEPARASPDQPGRGWHSSAKLCAGEHGVGRTRLCQAWLAQPSRLWNRASGCVGAWV